MKITVSVKSKLVLGNVCYEECSNYKQIRNGKVILHCRSSHIKNNKNNLMKNLLLNWSDKTLCSILACHLIRIVVGLLSLSQPNLKTNSGRDLHTHT